MRPGGPDGLQRSWSLHSPLLSTPLKFRLLSSEGLRKGQGGEAGGDAFLPHELIALWFVSDCKNHICYKSVAWRV